MSLTAADHRRLARANLTDKQFDAWCLVEWEGVSKRRAAKFLGISRSTLNDHLEAAQTRLVRAYSQNVECGERRRGTTSEPLSAGSVELREHGQDSQGDRGEPKRRGLRAEAA